MFVMPPAALENGTIDEESAVNRAQEALVIAPDLGRFT